MIRPQTHTIKPILLCISVIVLLLANRPKGFAQLDTLTADSVSAYFADTIQRKTEYFTQSHWNTFVAVDTSLLQIQKYNPVRRQDIPFAYLTNLGAPYYNRLLQFDRELGFDIGRNTIALYQNHMTDLSYYRTNAPFTEIFYLLGTKGEQWIWFKHIQNISPQLNFALGFDKPVATGYYLRERKSYSNADLTVAWRTRNNRYKAYLGIIYNEVANEENGGVAVDSLFDSYTGPRNLAEVFRDNSITEWHSMQGQFTHTYDFGKTVDSLTGDTTVVSTFVPAVQLLHRLGAADFDYSFKDADGDNSYYPVIYAEADTLRDVSDVDGFYNYISIGNLHLFNPDSLPLLWEISVDQQTYNLSDNSGSHTKFFLIPAATLHWNIADGLSLYGKVGSDVIQSDLSGSAALRKELKHLNAGMNAVYKKIEPNWMMQHYSGFAYRWDTALDDIQFQSIGLYAEVPKWVSSLSVNVCNFDNYVFYDTVALPFQDPGAFQSVQLLLKQHMQFGNFYLDNVFQLQFLSKYKKYFPFYASNHTFYFMRNLFKSALIIQTGLDVWYATDYYGYGYNITTGQFYLQDDTKLEFSPVVDVFVNFDIRTLRFFLKFDNVAMGLFDRGYFEAPGYPMQDRTFKIGIDWQLYY